MLFAGYQKPAKLGNFLFAALKLLTILKMLKETLLRIPFSVIVRCSLVPTFHWLQGKCTYRKSNLCIPGKELSQSQFLHWCVCEQFVYSQDRSRYWAAAKKTDRSWKCIILSQIFECRNWEIEHNNSVLVITRLHSYSFLGITPGPSFEVSARINFSRLPVWFYRITGGFLWTISVSKSLLYIGSWKRMTGRIFKISK